MSLETYGSEKIAPISGPGLERHDPSPPPPATSGQAEKQRRNRLTRQEQEEQYRNFIAFLKYGCSMEAIKQILNLDKKKLGQLSSLAVERREQLVSTEKKLVLHQNELPSAMLEKLKNAEAGLLMFTFDLDGPSGHFQAVSAEELLENLQSPGGPQ